MAEKVQQIVARLAEKGEETAAFFRALAPEDWDAQIYTEGTGWRVQHVLCHFVSAERSFVRLFQNIVAGGEGAPRDMDIDVFNEAEVAGMADLEPADLIAGFEEARAALIDFMRGLDDSDLDRQGRHPWFGVDRLEKFVKLVYRHNMIHQRDIRRALDGTGS